MRKLIVVLTMAALSGTGALLAIAPAGASVGSESKVCKILTGITIDPSSDPTGAGGRANAKKYSKALSKAAKQVKGDIKKTLKTLAKYYKDVANGNTDALENEAEDFGKATAKYASYIVSNCISSELPGGVTIPTFG
jgi:hypothetical protein